MSAGVYVVKYKLTLLLPENSLLPAKVDALANIADIRRVCV